MIRELTNGKNWNSHPEGYIRPSDRTQLAKLRRHETRQERRYDQVAYCERRDAIARAIGTS